ncbi:MAG: hypothetical protein LBI38_07735 [Oscillospiraceae bacterium]|jgi:hypothetical protein|nr:hypothetical protein [Oscillospiraceae bacterium]
MGKKKKSKVKDNVKINNTEIKDKVVYVLVIVLPIAFLVGGFALFVRMNDAKYIPDGQYAAAERIVKDKALTGLTFEECANVIGYGGLKGKSGLWIFAAGHKENPDMAGDNVIYYEICVYNDGDKATKAVLREARGD